MTNNGYCSKCGIKISKSEMICPNCGTKTDFNSENSAQLNYTFNKFLIVFLAGVIGYQILNAFVFSIYNYLVSNFGGLFFFNSNVDNFPFSNNVDIVFIIDTVFGFHYNSSNTPPLILIFLLGLFVTVIFILFLYFLTKFYKITLNKKSVIPFLLEIFIVSGIGSGIGFFINNSTTAPFINSNHTPEVIFYYVVAQSDLFIYIFFYMIYYALLITVFVSFIIFLQNRNTIPDNSTQHYNLASFILIALAIGLFSYSIGYYLEDYLLRSFYITNQSLIPSIIIGLLSNCFTLILCLVPAGVFSKFHSNLSNKQILIYCLLFFILSLFGRILSIIITTVFAGNLFLKGTEPFIIQNVFNNIPLLLILNISFAFTITIGFFASIFLIQIYTSKIELESTTERSSLSKHILSKKNV